VIGLAYVETVAYWPMSFAESFVARATFRAGRARNGRQQVISSVLPAP
jgi:hypothetical protein